MKHDIVRVIFIFRETKLVQFTTENQLNFGQKGFACDFITM